MDYQFLIDTYETERIKVLSTWSTFKDEDLSARPHPNDKRGRNALEQMIHQCMGENKWFTGMLGVDVGAPPLPENETRLEFIKRYAEDSGKRVEALKEKDDDWWQKRLSSSNLISHGHGSLPGELPIRHIIEANRQCC